MRVLTIHEPWATLAASGRKPWENRPPRVAAFARKIMGERIAIHAGLKTADYRDRQAPDLLPWPEQLHHGFVVGMVTIERVVGPGEEPGPWRDVQLAGIRFGEARLLSTPVPLKGGQGWGQLPAEISKELEHDDGELTEPDLRRLVTQLRTAAEDLQIARGYLSRRGRGKSVAIGHVDDAEKLVRKAVNAVERHRRMIWDEN